MEKLFLLSNASGYGGSERSIEILTSKLCKVYDLFIFIENPKHYDNIRVEQLANNYPFQIITLKQGKSLLTVLTHLFRISYYLIKEKPDIVLANTNKAGFYLAIMACLFCPAKHLALYIRDFQWRYLQLILKLMNRATVIFPTKAVFTRVSGLSSSNHTIKIVPDPVHFGEEPKENRDNSSCVANSEQIVCLAGYTRWKGLEYLIKSFSYLYENIKTENTHKSLALSIYGEIVDESYFYELKTLVDALHLEGHVHLHTYCKDVKVLYQNALFVVSSSIAAHGGPETFGRTIIEAWSYKKPAIAFDVGGPQSIIDNGINGFLVEEKNCFGLADKMIRLLKDEVLRRRMGEAGFQKARRCFADDIIARQLEGVLSRRAFGD